MFVNQAYLGFALKRVQSIAYFALRSHFHTFKFITYYSLFVNIISSISKLITKHYNSQIVFIYGTQTFIISQHTFYLTDPIYNYNSYFKMLAIMKGCSSIGAIFILIIGLAMTAITIYGYFHPELFFNETEDRNVILGILIGADLAIVLGALLGMCGIKKQNNGLICIFQILVIIFCIVFLGLGIGSELLPNTVFPGNCTNSDNKMIQFANQAYKDSLFLFCFPGCPCNLTDAAKQSPTYSDIQKQALNAYSTSSTGPINSQNCALFPRNDSLVQVSQALQGIQQLLDCSLWCDGVSDLNLIYRFSDVNKGKPQSFCYSAMKIAVSNYSHVIGIAAFAVAAFLLLMCLCNLCLCCHPSRKDLSLRQRFVYQREGIYQQPNMYRQF